MKNFLTILLFLFPYLAQAQLAPAQGQLYPTVYISNGGFENAASGWKAYKDSGSALPVDATGGSPTLTITASSSSPLLGKSSGLITKPASNTQGEGASYAFVVDPASRGKVLTVSGTYQVISGTYSGGTSSTDSDIEVYIYDIDANGGAGQVIQPSGYKLDGAVSGTSYDIKASFQTSSSSANYRLVFHNPNTTATAFVLKIDEIIISKSRVSQGHVETGWTSYTPSILSGFGTTTPTTNQCKYKIQASNMLLDCSFIAGSGTATVLQLGLPAGFTSSSTIFSNTPAGYGIQGNTGGNTPKNIIPLRQPSVNYVNFALDYYGATLASNTPIQGNTAGYVGSGGFISFTASIPIQGLESTQLLSSETDTRVVAFLAQSTATSIVSSGQTTLSWAGATTDTHGCFNGTTSCTIKVPGYYDLSLIGSMTIPTGTFSATATCNIQVNGSSVVTNSSAMSNNMGTGNSSPMTVRLDAYRLKSSDVITAQCATNNAIGATTFGSAVLSVVMRQAPSQIAPMDTILATAYNSSGQSLTNATPANVTGWTVSDDTRGALATTGIFTAPAPGYYRATLLLSYTWVNSNGYKACRITKVGGSDLVESKTASPNIVGNATAVCYWTGRLNAGEQIRPLALQQSGATEALDTQANANFWAIERTGN